MQRSTNTECESRFGKSFQSVSVSVSTKSLNLETNEANPSPNGANHVDNNQKVTKKQLETKGSKGRTRKSDDKNVPEFGTFWEARDVISTGGS